MACVYWIRKKEHNDIFTQGYIGFTSKTAEHRFKCHKKFAMCKLGRAPHLERAIRKNYPNNLIIQTLCVGTDEYCLDLENKLRPTHNIGWNNAIGGEKPAIGRIVSVATREKLRISSTGRKHSPETILKLSESRKGKSSHNKGKTVSDAQKEKIRSKLLGGHASEETKKKLSIYHLKAWADNPHRRIEMAERTRKRNTGKVHSDEARANMSKARNKTLQCPHCNKSGKMAGMVRWHFNNCKSNAAAHPAKRSHHSRDT